MPTRRRRRYPELPQKGRFSGFGRGLASFMGDMGQAFGFNILNQAAEERMREFQAAESAKQRELEREGLEIEQRRVDALDAENLLSQRAQDLTEQTKQRDQLFAQLSPDIKRGNWQAIYRILGDPVAAHLTGGAGQDVDLLANPLQPLGGEDTGAGLVGPFDDDPQGWYDLIQDYDTRDPRYIAQHIANLGEQYGLPIDERGRPTQPELGKAGMTLADIPREAIDQYAADVQFQSVTPGLSGWIHGAPAPDEAAMVGDRATRLGGDPMPDFADTLAAYQEPIEHSRDRMLEELKEVGELPLTRYEKESLAVQRAWADANKLQRRETPASADPCLNQFGEKIPGCTPETVDEPFTPVPDQALNLALAHQNTETGGWVFPGQPPDSKGMRTDRAFTLSLIKFDQIIKEEEAEQVRLAGEIARARRQDAGLMPPDESVLRDLQNEKLQSEFNLEQAELQKLNLQTHYGVRLPLDLEKLGASDLSMSSPTSLFDLIAGTDIFVGKSNRP
jgi:hypothetical protein